MSALALPHTKGGDSTISPYDYIRLGESSE